MPSPEYFSIVRVPDYIVAGMLRLTSDDILIGTDLAILLGVTVGDRLLVSARSSTPRSLTITAIFDLGSKGANLRTTFVAFRTGQSLLNLVGGVTSLEIAVADAFAAETIAQDIAGRAPACAPTAGSRPTPSSSPPCRRRTPPTS